MKEEPEKSSTKYLAQPKSVHKPSPRMYKTQNSPPKQSTATLQKGATFSDAGTTRTRAASKKSSRSRKVNSTFGADLSKVYSFDQPDDEKYENKTKMTKKLQKEYINNKLKELKNTYKSNNELSGRL